MNDRESDCETSGPGSPQAHVDAAIEQIDIDRPGTRARPTTGGTQGHRPRDADSRTGEALEKARGTIRGSPPSSAEATQAAVEAAVRQRERALGWIGPDTADAPHAGESPQEPTAGSVFTFPSRAPATLGVALLCCVMAVAMLTATPLGLAATDQAISSVSGGDGGELTRALAELTPGGAVTAASGTPTPRATAAGSSGSAEEAGPTPASTGLATPSTKPSTQVSHPSPSGHRDRPSHPSTAESGPAETIQDQAAGVTARREADSTGEVRNGSTPHGASARTGSETTDETTVSTSPAAGDRGTEPASGGEMAAGVTPETSDTSQSAAEPPQPGAIPMDRGGEEPDPGTAVETDQETQPEPGPANGATSGSPSSESRNNGQSSTETDQSTSGRTPSTDEHETERSIGDGESRSRHP